MFLSCRKLNESEGAYNDIVIITSDVDKIHIDKKINNLFYAYVNTPSKENFYNVIWVDPNAFKDYLNYRNILFISLESPSDSTIDLINEIFFNQYNQEISILNDLYSKNQSVLFFNSLDINDFKIKIDNYKDWILNEFNNNIEKNIETRIVYYGENDSLNAVVIKNFGLDIFVQKDYTIIKNDDDYDFLWIGRGYPYRWITFMKFNYNELNSYKSHWDFYEYILKKNMPNVSISDYYRKDVYNNGELVNLRGLYEENFSDTGGPFFTKIFKLNNDNGIYISGFVNNPGKSKYLLLKELDVIINNTKIMRSKNE